MNPTMLSERVADLDPELSKNLLLLILDQLANARHTDDRGGRDFYLLDDGDLERVLATAKRIAPGKQITAPAGPAADPIAEMFRYLGEG